jgi:sterol 3beta-glucosyltransferase
LTGYWLIDPDMEGSPSQDLIDFMDSGPPPITIALGSTRTDRIREIIHQAINALEILNQRGIIIVDQLESARLSSNILLLSYAPYSWVFQRSAAVIHHGGAGTTARGLLAGVPNIIIPFTSDQPFWGRRVFSLGVGPRPIPARRITVSRLVQAVDEAQHDLKMQEKAWKLSDQIRAEEGKREAVRIIEQNLE